MLEIEGEELIELFAGIGSQTQALKNIGVPHKVVGICEIDEYAYRSYQAIHGPTKNFGDITKVKSLPKATIWTYSFPCTDLSNAGKQNGLARGSGTRSGLLWEVERLLKVSEKPKCLLMENVKPLVGEKFSEGFNEWRKSLVDMGYRNYYQVLNAKDYGVPQNRERVFMVSILGPGEPFSFPEKEKLHKKLKDMLEVSAKEKYYLKESAYRNLLRNGNGNCHPSGNGMNGVVNSKDVANTITTNKGEGQKILEIKEATKKGYAVAHAGDGISLEFPDSETRRGRVQLQLSPTLQCNDSKGVVVSNMRIRKITPLESLRLMGFSDTAYRMIKAVGMSNSQIYKQAGNSIVVDVLERIFRSLLLEDKGNIQDTQMEFL